MIGASLKTVPTERDCVRPDPATYTLRQDCGAAHVFCSFGEGMRSLADNLNHFSCSCARKRFFKNVLCFCLRAREKD